MRTRIKFGLETTLAKK